MDELDRNLLSAWQRVSELCRRDPAEARRRWGRTRGTILSATPRAWCLAVRASDTRIRPQAFGYLDDDGLPFREEHQIDLTGSTMAELCAPVRIDWPGMPLHEAARMLGRHAEALRHWVPTRPGRTRAARRAKAPQRYEEINDPRFPLRVRYEKAQQHGHFGYDVPVVWSPPLDTGASRGDSPHPVWGSLWQYLHRRIDENRYQTLQRTPRWRPYRNETRFRGWNWTCPGRAGATCGRTVQTLYYPLPVYTIARCLGAEGFDVNETNDDTSGARQCLHLAGQWFPGADDLPDEQRLFACERCWNIRRFWLTNHRGWNEFVTYISGGLLYGHEVARPPWVNFARKRPAGNRKRIASKTRRRWRKGQAVDSMRM